MIAEACNGNEILLKSPYFGHRDHFPSFDFQGAPSPPEFPLRNNKPYSRSRYVDYRTGAQAGGETFYQVKPLSLHTRQSRENNYHFLLLRISISPGLLLSSSHPGLWATRRCWSPATWGKAWLNCHWSSHCQLFTVQFEKWIFCVYLVSLNSIICNNI